jgi:hypothetical protein
MNEFIFWFFTNCTTYKLGWFNDFYKSNFINPSSGSVYCFLTMNLLLLIIIFICNIIYFFYKADTCSSKYYALYAIGYIVLNQIITILTILLISIPLGFLGWIGLGIVYIIMLIISISQDDKTHIDSIYSILPSILEFSRKKNIYDIDIEKYKNNYNKILNGNFTNN